MIIVVMGVSGAGKTLIGTLLAKRMQTVFADADTFHSAANIAKMASGHPLNDEDRQLWLERLNTVLRGWSEEGKGGVLACSALKEAYRKTLVHGVSKDSVRFVWLDGSKKLIAKRLAERKGHYMDPKLLDSQLGTLEPPANALRVVNNQTPMKVVDEILKAIMV